MCPVRHPPLHHSHHQRGARGVEQTAIGRIAQDLPVCRQNGGIEKAADVGQFGLGFLLVQGGNGLQRQLCRHLALWVSAHAVRQQKQARAVGIAIAHAVFVFFAPTLAADLEYRKFHLGRTLVAATVTGFLLSATILSNCMRTFSATLSLV